MQRNLIICLLLLKCYSTLAQNENLAGRWEGVIMSNTLQTPRTVYFTVQFNQSGKAVWGVYSYGEQTALHSCDCAGKFTSKLSATDNSPILIYKDDVIEHHNILLDSCISFNYLQAAYSKEGKDEFLKGSWYDSNGNRLSYSGASGSFILKKENAVADINIDQYFPRLKQLVRRFNSY